MPDTIYFLAEDPIIAPVGTMSRFSIDESERNHFTGLLEQTSKVKKKVSSYSLRQKRRSTITKEIEVPIPPQRHIHHHHRHHHSVNVLDP